MHYKGKIFSLLITTLFFILPSISFGAFTGTQWSGSPWAISTSGVITRGNTDAVCTGSETVHFMVQQDPFTNPYSGTDTDGWAKTTGYNNVGCSGGTATDMFGASGTTYDLETAVTAGGGSNPALKEYYLFVYKDGNGCTWVDNTCTADTASAGNIKLTRVSTGVSTFSWSISFGTPPDTSTRFIDITPTDKAVVNAVSAPFSATSTATVTISADIYFNDVESGNYIDQVCTYLEKIDQGIGPGNYGQTLAPVCTNIITSGASTVDMVFTDLPWGRYFAVVSFSNPAYENFQPQSFEFINQYTLVGGANQSCLFGEDYNGFCNDAEPPDGYASTTPTAFRGIPLEDCDAISWTEPLEKSFCVTVNSMYRIVNYLFIPDEFVWNTFVGDIKDDMLTHFPLGYFYDFATIIATTTEGTIPAISATLPIDAFGNPSITLDITHSLDYILYATTSEFFNEDIASSTETFYDVTSSYWEKIVWIMTAFYLISRIIGSGIIPGKQKIK